MTLSLLPTRRGLAESRCRRRGALRPTAILFTIALVLLGLGVLVSGIAVVRTIQIEAIERQLRADATGAHDATEALRTRHSKLLTEIGDLRSQASAASARGDAAAADRARQRDTLREASGGFTGAAITHRRVEAERIFEHVLNAIAGVGVPATPFTTALITKASAHIDQQFAQPIEAIERRFIAAALRLDLAAIAAHHTERAGRVLATAHANDATSERDAPTPPATSETPSEQASAPPPKETAAPPQPASDNAARMALVSQLSSLRQLASKQAESGALDEAQATWQKAMDLVASLQESARPAARQQLLKSKVGWLMSAGLFNDAEPLARESLAFEQRDGEKVTSWAETANTLTRLLLKLHRPDDALDVARSTAAAFDAARIPNENNHYLAAQILQAHALRLLKRSDEESEIRTRIDPTLWYQNARFGINESREWVEYLIAQGEFERAESTRWVWIRGQIERGSTRSVVTEVRELAAMLERAGLTERAAPYRRWLLRQKAAAEPDDESSSD